MDKIYNDIHYVMEKEKRTLFVLREVQILSVIFETDVIKIRYRSGILALFEETLVIPKLSYCKLIID